MWNISDMQKDGRIKKKGQNGSKKNIPPGAWMSVSCECCVCQVEVSATSWYLLQRSPTECVVSKKV
jgi:hypothetical protein